MVKGEKRSTQKHQKSTSTHAKGRFLEPMASPAPRRCSRRLLEAKRFVSRINVMENPPTSLMVDTYAQVVTQETCLVNRSPAQNVPTIKKFSHDAPILTKVLISSKATLLSDSQAKKSTAIHAATAPPSIMKRGKFVKEENDKPTQIKVNGPPVMALTEIVAMAKSHPNSDYEGEVVSSYNPASITVNGYKVKAEFAYLVRKMIKRYGDIVRKCPLQSSDALSFFLEMICDILQRLQGTSFKEITTVDLNDMLKKVSDIENSGIRVGWLGKYINEICEAKNKMLGSLLMKEKKDRIKKDIENIEAKYSWDELLLKDQEEELARLQVEVVLLRERICVNKENLASLKSKDEEIEAAAFDTSAKVTSFINKSNLLDDLL